MGTDHASKNNQGWRKGSPIHVAPAPSLTHPQGGGQVPQQNASHYEAFFATVGPYQLSAVANIVDAHMSGCVQKHACQSTCMKQMHEKTGRVLADPCRLLGQRTRVDPRG